MRDPAKQHLSPNTRGVFSIQITSNTETQLFWLMDSNHNQLSSATTIVISETGWKDGVCALCICLIEQQVVGKVIGTIHIRHYFLWQHQYANTNIYVKGSVQALRLSYFFVKPKFILGSRSTHRKMFYFLLTKNKEKCWNTVHTIFFIFLQIRLVPMTKIMMQSKIRCVNCHDSFQLTMLSSADKGDSIYNSHHHNRAAVT